MAIGGEVQRLPHELIGGGVAGLGVVRAVLDPDVPQRAGGADEHHVAGALPPPPQLGRGIQVHPLRQHHVDRAGKDVGHHGVRVVQEAHHDGVQRRPALVVTVEAGQLHVRAGLPARQAVGAEPDELGGEEQANIAHSYEIAGAEWPGSAGINPLTLRDLHWLKQLDDEGLIDDLHHKLAG